MMRVKTILKRINNETLESLWKNIRLSVAEAPRYINVIKEERKKVVYDKITHFNKWYTKIIGLDKVKVFQDRATSLHEELLKAQEKRREIGSNLKEVREESKEIHNEILKINRQEDFKKYIEMMMQEDETIQLEKSMMLEFQSYEQMERELFTAFTNAVRDSQERQRIQIEYTKYFGLLLSITGSFLAFIYGMVKKQYFNKFIEQKLSNMLTNTSFSKSENKTQTRDSYFTNTNIIIGVLALGLLVRVLTG